MKIFLLSATFTLIAALSAISQDNIANDWVEKPYNSKPKVGLALSGGAAHGLAHIGLLKYLEEQNIQIDNITGTSMGAVIGGLYAIGYDADQCIKIASEIDWNDILSSKIYSKDISPSERYNHEKYPLTINYRNGDFVIPQSIINSNKLDLLLEELFAPAYLKEDFNDLNIPFRCYGVDVVDGTIIEMKSGRLSNAIRASMAIPSIFSPWKVNDTIIVDGGLIRNFPVSNNYDMGSDIVIGSYVGSSRGEASDLNGLFDILKQSAFMMSIKDSEEQEKLASILITPEVKSMSKFGFDQYEKFIELGYQAAKSREEQFKKLKTLLDSYGAQTVRNSLVKSPYLFINKVIVNGMQPLSQYIIRSKLDIDNKSYTTYENIKKGINAIHATKSFRDIKYHLSPSEKGTNLVIEGEEIQQVTIGANINHFRSTSSAIVLDLQARNYIGEQSNINLKLRISENFGIAADYYQRGILFKEGLIFGLKSKLERSELTFYREAQKIHNTFMWEGQFEPYILWEANNSLSLKLNWKIRGLELSNSIHTNRKFRAFEQGQLSTALELEYNTLDSPHFSKSGIKFRHKLKYVYSNSTSSISEDPIDDNFIKPGNNYFSPSVSIFTTTKLMSRLYLESTFSGQYRKKGYFVDNELIGGVNQNKEYRLGFIGLRESQLMLSSYGYIKLALRCQLSQRLYTSLVINGVAGNSPNKRFVGDNSNDEFTSLIGFGINIGIDLPIGPIYFDIGYVNKFEKITPTFGLGYRHIW